MKYILAFTVLAAALPLAAQEPKPYGFQAGTLAASIDGGGMAVSGSNRMFPAATASVEIGVHKYLGVFADGGYSRSTETAYACSYFCYQAKVSDNLYKAGAGVEVMGTNHTRFVPYGRLGVAYAAVAERGAVSSGYVSAGYWAAAGAPAVMGAGGLRIYLNHHVGIDTQVQFLHTVGANGGANALVPTAGVFFQSK